VLAEPEAAVERDTRGLGPQDQTSTEGW